MKRYSLLSFLLIICITISQISVAQKKKKDQLPTDMIYLLKSDWSAANGMDEATYFLQIIKQSDSDYTCLYYQKFGPLVRQESFKDADLTIPNGRFCWYNDNGELDSTGWVTNGKKDDNWDYYMNGKKLATIRYNVGKFVDKRDYNLNTYSDASGASLPLDKKEKQDSEFAASFSEKPIEAKFQNGDQDWVKYIQKNLKTPDRLMNVRGAGQHNVIVVFMINKQGMIDPDIYLLKSVEWSADAEVFSLIKNSPQWYPATVDGKPVYYRQKQSLTFSVN